MRSSTPRAPRQPKGWRAAWPAISRTLGTIRPTLRTHRKVAAGGLAALLLEVAMRLLEPWPVKFILDGVLPAAVPGGVVAPGIGTVILLSAIAALVIVALRATGAYLSTVAFALVGSRVTTWLRGRIYDHLLALSLRFHDRSRAGDLLTRLTGDVQRLQEVAVTAGLPLVGNVVTFVGMTVVMLVLDPLLAIAVLAVVPLFFVSSGRASTKITAASREQRSREGEIAAAAGESLGAMRVVQAYGLEPMLSGHFSSTNEKTLRTGVRARRLSAGLERRTDLLVGVATAAVLLAGANRVLDGSLTPGELVVFLTYLKSAFKPMRDVAKHTGRIARAAASGERVADLLDTVPTIRDRTHARALRAVRGDVRLEGVRAEYEPGQPVLTDVDLHILPGERVALSGPSGAGKSTIASLLLRFVEPQAGVVRIDGHDVADVTLASLRSHITVVLQDSVLFATSIRENIRWGRPDATDDEIEAVARLANAHGFVLALPDGYETAVGERGVTMSGGQRQRIAIARAMLRDSAIVILDEPTTGLDEANQREVLDALGRLIAGRTTIVITHDPALTARCDRVVEIVGGTVTSGGCAHAASRTAKAGTDGVGTDRVGTGTDRVGSDQAG